LRRFSLKTAKNLKIGKSCVITVIGKAFYDVAHASAAHSNRRSKPEGYAVWEIHPVMALQVAQQLAQKTHENFSLEFP
jgi:hypothetical protein